MSFMIALPKSVRRFLTVFLLASLCAYFSYIAYLTPFHTRGLTLSQIERLEESLRTLPKEQLTQMRRAGLEAKSWLSSCELSGRSMLTEITPGTDPMQRSIHAPKEDVFDEKTGSQYYFHRHRTEETGHFHLFLWTDHIPGLTQPVQASPSGGFVHLIAISTDARGYPIRLFTTNQWVTGEDWRPAHEVNCLVKNFEISHGEPSWPVNRSLSAFVRLFAPQIRELIDLRDDKISEECRHRPLSEVLKDRSINVLSEMPVDIDAQMLSIEAALAEQSLPISSAPTH